MAVNSGHTQCVDDSRDIEWTGESKAADVQADERVGRISKVVS